MKINPISTIIAACISAFIAYAFYCWAPEDAQHVNCICSAIWSAVTLFGALGISYKESRLSANVKVLSYVFFVVLLVANIIIAVSRAGNPTYVIVLGILLLIYVLIAYAINKATN